MSKASRIGKWAAKKMIRKVGRGLFRLLIVKTAPIWIPLILFLSLIGFAYFALLEYPKTAIGDVDENVLYRNDAQRAFAFFGQDKGVDIEIFDKYKREADRWSEGLTDEQLSQVDIYMLDWQWIAAVDRTFANPDIILSTKPKQKLHTDPSKTFEVVRPKFSWREEQKKISSQSCHVSTVKDGEGNEELDDNGNPMVEYSISTNEYEVPQTILLLAKTIQGEYEHLYKEETITTYSSSECGSLEEKITFKKLSQIIPITNEWEPLKEYLSKQGINRITDQYFLLDYWLSFLTDQDGTEFMPLPNDWIPVEDVYAWPSYGRLSSQFGMRIHPITKKKEVHNGVDIAAKTGTPVMTIADGTVIYAGFMGTAGNAIIVNHESFESRYYHLSAIHVSVGDVVTKGSSIGKVGSTGSSTGPHLHFEIRVAGDPVNPIPYYD